MGGVDARQLIQRLTKTARAALADLYDQSRPFGRLVLVHTLMTAGTTIVTVGLAGTLFFSISLHSAEKNVLLYLLITIAPFAIVAPALSPLIDRGRQARRTAVVIASAGSALLCLAMISNLRTFFLFPEAFGILVLTKLYLVARAALVPAMAGSQDDLASANAKLAVMSALGGFAVSPIAVGFLQIGGAVVMGFAMVVFLAATVAALRLPRVEVPAAVPVNPPAAAPGSAVPGGLSATAPAGVYGPSLPAGGGGVGAVGPPARPALGRGSRREPLSGREIRARRRELGLGRYHPAVLAAFTAMCVVRGSVGFVTFFLAFNLKRANAATWWYGFIVLASGIGGLAGSSVVPVVRRRLSEERIIFASLVLSTLFALGTALIGGLWAQPLLTFVVGLAGTTAKPSFDSLVQREVPALMQGRAFARFETWLQLVWVAAALVAVIVDFRLRDGDIVVAVACGIAAFFYASMRHSARYHEAHLAQPAAP